jgi:hypothetical protein
MTAISQPGMMTLTAYAGQSAERKPGHACRVDFGPRRVHDERRERKRQHQSSHVELPHVASWHETDEQLRDIAHEPDEAHDQERAVHRVGLAVRSRGPPAAPSPAAKLAHPHQQHRAVGERAERVNEQRQKPQRIHGRENTRSDRAPERGI